MSGSRERARTGRGPKDAARKKKCIIRRGGRHIGARVCPHRTCRADLFCQRQMSRRWWQQADEDVSAGGGDDDAPPWSDDDSHWGHIEPVNVHGPKGETLKEFPQPTMKPIPCWPLPTPAPRAGGGASGGADRAAAAPPAGRADAPAPRPHPSNSASTSATYPSANPNPSRHLPHTRTPAVRRTHPPPVPHPCLELTTTFP